MKIITGKSNYNGAVFYGIYDTIFGRLLIAENEFGICYIGFCDGDRLADIFCYADISREDGKVFRLVNVVESLWRGQKSDVGQYLTGTDFQLRVWKALMDIPAGEVWSYANVAKAAKCSDAVRAVGSAVGRNPVSILIPCHRVIRADGSIGNYGWGVEKKRQLLQREGVCL